MTLNCYYAPVCTLWSAEFTFSELIAWELVKTLVFSLFKVCADVAGIFRDVALYRHVVVVTETFDQPTTRVISAIAGFLVRLALTLFTLCTYLTLEKSEHSLYC